MGDNMGETHKTHFDPKIQGPGNWDALHTIALHSDENDTLELFLTVFDIIILGFKCLDCRPHAIKYRKEHPPEIILYKYTISSTKIRFDRKNIRTKYPCSYYMNLFHNSVNHRLGKNVYDLSESIKITRRVCEKCEID